MSSKISRVGVSKPKVALLLPTITRSGGGVSEAVRLLHDVVLEDGRWNVEVHTIVADGFDIARIGYGETPVFGAKRRDRTRFGFSPELLARLLSSDADVLHVHGLWGFHCLAAYIWHRRTRQPYIVTPHGMLERWIMSRSRIFKTAVMKLYQRRLLRGAASVQVLTEKERGDVENAVPGLSITQIPNFVVAPNYSSYAGRPRWLSTTLEGRRIFLFFGRIHEKKGCMELCDAWDRLCQANPYFAQSNALVFCGWTDGLHELDARITELDQRYGNVIAGGPQFGDEKWKSMAAATFMVLPSKSEGLPLAILEAWSIGLPVIMTPECNLPEGFEAGAAISISPNVEDVMRGIEAAAKLSERRVLKMSEAAKTLTHSTFSAKFVGEKMIALYEDALTRSSN